MYSIISSFLESNPFLERRIWTLVKHMLNLYALSFMMIISFKFIINKFIAEICIFSILSSGTVYYFGEFTPIDSTQAHRAWFTTRVNRTSFQREGISSFACSSNGHDFSMSSWIIQPCHWVDSSSYDFSFFIYN